MKNATYQKDAYDIIIENLTKEWFSMNSNFKTLKWARPEYSKKQIESK